MTSVINIRNAPLGWEKDPAFVYIGRAGRGFEGPWGNPHPVGSRCLRCAVVHTRGEALERFKEDILKVPTDAFVVLRGKTLVCFCKPLPCHGDILAEAAEAAS